jgi:hypothetical protein
MRSLNTKSRRAPSVDTTNALPLYFEIGGADRGSNVMDIEIRTTLPVGTELTLEAPASVMQQLLRGKPPFVKVQPLPPEKSKSRSTESPADPWESALIGEKEIWSITLLSQVPNLFKDVSLPEKCRGSMRLHVGLREKTREALLVTVRQLLAGCEVGKLTFDLMPRNRGEPTAGVGSSESSEPAVQDRKRQPARSRKKR